MHVVSSSTTMPAEPSSEPAFCTPSKLACVSSCEGSRIGTDEPPGMTAFSVRPSRTPPARPSINSRSVMFIDASYTPGLRTCPLTQYNLGPPFLSGPRPANHSAPFLRVNGTLLSVSTLFTPVGQLYSPPRGGDG